jgi:hypothetical protein
MGEVNELLDGLGMQVKRGKREDEQGGSVWVLVSAEAAVGWMLSGAQKEVEEWEAGREWKAVMMLDADTCWPSRSVTVGRGTILGTSTSSLKPT